MEIRIEETGELQELCLVDNISKEEYSESYLAGYDALGKYDSSTEAYEMSLEEYIFWEEHIRSKNQLNKKIYNLAKEMWEVSVNPQNNIRDNIADIEEKINLSIGQGTFLAEDELDMSWNYFSEIQEDFRNNEKTKKQILEKLTGNYIQVTSKWVKENDPDLFNWMIEKIEEFIADPHNDTNQADLQDFSSGKWLVEYHFNHTNYWYCAGNEEEIANQSEWGYDTYYDQYKSIDVDLLQKFVNLIHS